MSWQDIIISIANIFFATSLTVQVYYGIKEKSGPIKYLTSIPTCAGLYAIAIAFWTLGLYSSAAISFFNGTLWLALSIQRMIYSKNNAQ